MQPSARGCTPGALGTRCDPGRWEPARRAWLSLSASLPWCAEAARAAVPACEVGSCSGLKSHREQGMEGGSTGWPPHRPHCHASGEDPAWHAPGVTWSSLGAALGCGQQCPAGVPARPWVHTILPTGWPWRLAGCTCPHRRSRLSQQIPLFDIFQFICKANAIISCRSQG